MTPSAEDQAGLLVRVGRKGAHDLAGLKFGRLTVIRRAGTDRFRAVIWKCLCDCGTEKDVRAGNLRTGDVSSCGCFQRDDLGARSTIHGRAGKFGRDPEYTVWRSMKARCDNPKNVAYHNYGARGISVCPAWRDDYGAFIKNVGRRPAKEFSIDRIDVNGNYEPGNCRWATLQEQSENKRTNRPVLRSDGEVFPTISAASRSVGTTPGTIADAIRAGRPSRGFSWAFVETGLDLIASASTVEQSNIASGGRMPSSHSGSDTQDIRQAGKEE